MQRVPGRDTELVEGRNQCLDAVVGNERAWPFRPALEPTVNERRDAAGIMTSAGAKTHSRQISSFCPMSLR